jgi:hypothetical protein
MAEKMWLVEQRATNGQTIQFIADRLAEMASQADDLAKKDPGFSSVGALSREHRMTLMEMAREEKRLATAIQLETQPDRSSAAAQREHRKDLLEMARAEGSLADVLEVWPCTEEDTPTVAVIAEQARRNRDLLRHVAGTQTQADRALRGAGSAEEEAAEEGPKWT